MPYPHPLALDQLPEVIARYLAAQGGRDTPAVRASAFTSDAIVTDDGSTYEGAEAVLQWLDRTAGAYTYTITPTAAERTGEERYTVSQHLEGNFPGGTVDLHFRFTLRGVLVERLVIEP